MFARKLERRNLNHYENLAKYENKNNLTQNKYADIIAQFLKELKNHF